MYIYISIQMNLKINAMPAVEIVLNFEGILPEATKTVIENEAAKLDLSKVDVYEGDTPASEGIFEVFADEDIYIFSVDSEGNIFQYGE